MFYTLSMSNDDPICSNCGYELLGLPRQGRCPECGQYYNMLSGEGTKGTEAAEEKLSFIFRRIRTVVLGLMTLASVGCGSCLSFYVLQNNNNKPFGISLVIGGLLLLATIASYLYERD